MIGIIDYGAGNLFSVKNALDYIGAESQVVSSASEIEMSDKLILPGVGAFPDAMRLLTEKGLDVVIKQQQKPLLGICLGMQLLFEVSSEFEQTKGLGLIDGEVNLIDFGDNPKLKIPHMGYNSLDFVNPCPLLKGIDEGAFVYFVHSYMAYTRQENIYASCEYNVKIPALVGRGNVFGAQFHPEKSGETGLAMLKNFADI